MLDGSVSILLLSNNLNIYIDNSPDRTSYAVGIRHHAIVGSAIGTTLSPLETTTARRVDVLDNIFDAR